MKAMLFFVIYTLFFAAVSFLIVKNQEGQTKLTKEQIKIMNIYCQAMPACKKEMEK